MDSKAFISRLNLKWIVSIWRSLSIWVLLLQFKLRWFICHFLLTDIISMFFLELEQLVVCFFWNLSKFALIIIINLLLDVLPTFSYHRLFYLCVWYLFVFECIYICWRSFYADCDSTWAEAIFLINFLMEDTWVVNHRICLHV